MESIIEKQVELGQELDNEFKNYERSGDRTEGTLKAIHATVSGIWAKFQVNHKVLMDNQASLKDDDYFTTNFYGKAEARKNALIARVNIRLAAFKPLETKTLGVDENGQPLKKEGSGENGGTSHPQNGLLNGADGDGTNEKDPITNGGKTTEDGSHSSIEQPGEALNLRKKLLNRIEFMEKGLRHATTGIENGSISLLQERIDDMKAEWKGLTEIYRKLLDIGQTKNDDDMYFAAKTEFETKISSIKERIRLSNEVKLPTVNIPTFSGKDPKEWPNFYDLFKKTIHENVHLANTQKMQYLKTYTKEEASRAIRHLTTSDTNYEAAWEIIQTKFCNPRKIIDHYVKSIREQARAQPNDARSLRALHDTTKECVYGISNMGHDIDACNIFLNHIIIEKLDKDTKRRFEQSLNDPKKIPNFKDLLTFIEEQAETLESIQVPQAFGAYTKQAIKGTDGQKCFVCKKEHKNITKCEEFMKMSSKERFEKVKEEKVCRLCFSPKHFTNSCESKYTCKKCAGKHSTLIHMELKKRQIIANTVTNESREVFLATALIKCKTKHGDYIILRTMIDSGSQGTFITEDAAQKLQLKREKVYAEVTPFGDTAPSKCKSAIEVEVGSLIDAEFSTSITTLVVKKITKLLPQEPVNVDSWSHLKSIELADPRYNIPAPVDMSIGSDSFGEFALNGLIKADPQSPYALLTTLGWIVMGKTNKKTNKIISCISNVQLDQQLKRFWEIESLANENTQRDDDEICEQFFRSNCTRGIDGRYTVALPFKKSIKLLGKSRNMAVAQMLQLEKKFKADPAYKERYVKCIQEYLELGHMVRVTQTEEQMATRTGEKIQYNTAYLPHHAVIKEASTTTKTRVVFDASRKTTSGMSVNDAMFVGPNIQQDIFSILLRWRKYPIVYSADIQKMYRQIWVRDEDAEFQRMVWRESEDQPIRDYKLTTVTFGTACAPYLATRTVQQRASEEIENFPEATSVIINDTYMDDSCSGTWNLEEAIQIQVQLKNMMKSAGFDLKKWTSNRVEFLNVINEDDREIQPAEFFDKTSIKILGLQWNNSGDYFIYAFEIDEKAAQGKITKRQFLSATAALFDPLGWLTPITVKIKMMFQKMWIDGTDWDENISVELQNEWDTFKTQAHIINEMKIERWIGSQENEEIIQLHGFSDASMKAYGACIYVRIIRKDGSSMITLLTAKNRVAPRTKEGKPEVTLPKLELCGALLLAQLLKKVKEAMRMPNIQYFLWCDSMVTISWIRGQPSRWKTFVGNRTTEIREITEPERWRYVPTDQNPADLASRGLFPADLRKNELWWKGPEWLKLGEENWPKQPTQFDTLEEMRTSRLVHTSVIDLEFFKRFSNWETLLRSLAMCLRFAHHCKKGERQTGEISLTEIQTTKTRVILQTQEKYFPAEMQALRKGKPVPTTSKTANLSPFLDKNGVMRLGGRLSNSMLPYTQKHPMILPAEAYVSGLIIDEAHRGTIHGGENATLAAVRNEYWIIGAKALTKAYLKKCVRCARVNTRVMQQIMADLPAPRVGVSKPFTHCGVDYAGPFDVRTAKGRGHRSYRGYIALFICLATKAIHLEVVSDLKSTGFIAAFKRFISRRSKPKHIYSDNGTNFTAANKFIQAQDKIEMNKIDKEITRFSTNRGITWHFNPPASPHMGGLWEAGVKSVKTSLKKLAITTFTFEELTTILCQIEACLNSRPLCPMTNDPDDLRILTPAHFLTGDSIVAPADNSVPEDVNMNLLTRWQLVQKVHRDFWNQWSQEYLARLQQRPKWLRQRESIRIGDLVLICDNNLASTKWPLGRVTRTFPGQDNVVRVVEVRTGNGIFKRPIVKLSLLPNPEAQRELSAADNAALVRQKEISTKLDSKSDLSEIKNAGAGAEKTRLAEAKPHMNGENAHNATKVSVEKSLNPKNTGAVTKKTRFTEKGSTSKGDNTNKGKKVLVEPTVQPKNTGAVTKTNRFAGEKSISKRKNTNNTTKVSVEKSVKQKADGAPRATRTRYGLRSLLTMLLIAFFGFSTVVAKDVEPFSITKFENEPGIYFEELGHAKLVNNEWHLIVYYNLENYFKQARLFRTHQKQMSAVCEMLKDDQETCPTILEQLSRHLEEISAKNEIFKVTGQKDEQKRRKRGLINGIGMIASEAFGVLDYRFAERYEEDIRRAGKDREYILNLVKNQTSIFDATANLMKSSSKEIDSQFRQLTKTCEAIERTVNDADIAMAQQKRFKMFAEMAIYQMMLLDRYANLQDAFIDLITDTHQGHTNPLLIPPEQLRQQVTFIQAHLPNDLSLPGGAMKENLMELYTTMKIKTRTMRTTIIFDVRLPLINNNEFQIFKLHPLPVIYGGKTVAIKPATPYLLISVRRDLYSGMSETELRACRESQTHFQCKHHKPLYRPEANTQSKCEIQLLLHKTKLDEQCKLQRQPEGDQWMQLNRPNRWLFSITRSKTIDIICQNEPHQAFLVGQGILELREHCLIQLPELQIQSAFQISTRLDRSYLPNINISEQLNLNNNTRRITIAPEEQHNSYVSQIDKLQQKMSQLQLTQSEYESARSAIPKYQVGTVCMVIAIIVVCIFFLRHKLCRFKALTQQNDIALNHNAHSNVTSNHNIQIDNGNETPIIGQPSHYESVTVVNSSI